ncbi:MAG TPA: alpha/beta fold hydrolase [Methylomirabilota bacterium]|nr:alpha/beta fold hydrolase [Methylomirabilota bacterium]
MADLLDAIEIEPRGAAEAAVIWLHGLGADGHDFEPIVPELGLGASPRIRFVFPHAPVQPVTINGGESMRAWYDIYNDRRHDEAGIRASQARVEALLARERARGVAPHRTVLAGFSQGGAIALQTGLRHAERLAGILALSTYLPLPETVDFEASPANRDVPIMMMHGTQDPLILLERASFSRRRLEELGYPIEWRQYRMQHAVCAEQIVEIGDWLRRILG